MPSNAAAEIPTIDQASGITSTYPGTLGLDHRSNPNVKIVSGPEELRESDFLSRYGGEEFALLATQTDLAGATALAEKLRTKIANSELAVVGPRGRVSVTVSIGVALYDGATTTTFDAADRALYEAKGAGKDCVVAAKPL